ncbi:MAG: ribosome silencing factor [Phycisphaerales bacterium]|nr:ribosome silencing factor [Phycisphaerales bacterium]
MTESKGSPAAVPGPNSGSDRSASGDAGLGFALEAARLAEDRHCSDVRLFDVRGRSHVCDFVLVASGTSDRQVKSVGAEMEDLGAEHGMTRFRTTSDPASTWVVVDFVDVVVHLFEPARRAYYDLDDLWGDAPELPFTRST